jgi:ferric-dicitrate binding protein FerR (iron transport regulator)
MKYDQLYQYFSGHSSSFQKKQVEEWIKEEDNLEQFYLTLANWEKQNLQYSSDTAEAINYHLTRMEEDISETTHADEQVSYRKVYRLRWLIAASFALLLLTGAGLYQAFWQYKTYATDYGETLSFTLTDGSQVTLNANSSLRIPRFGFDEDSRTVLLRGEAEFLVKHTLDHKQFIVKTPRALDVIVLGTEFTVFTRERATRVALNSGKVELSYTNQNKTERKLMKPGELAILDDKGQIEIQLILAAEDPAAWKDHRFVFSSTPLSEVALMLDEVFGVQVIIPEQQVAQMTVSGSFTAHSAEELIQTLSEASTLSYQKEKRKIILQTR